MKPVLYCHFLTINQHKLSVYLHQYNDYMSFRINMIMLCILNVDNLVIILFTIYQDKVQVHKCWRHMSVLFSIPYQAIRSYNWTATLITSEWQYWSGLVIMQIIVIVNYVNYSNILKTVHSWNSDRHISLFLTMCRIWPNFIQHYRDNKQCMTNEVLIEWYYFVSAIGQVTFDHCFIVIWRRCKTLDHQDLLS